MWCVNMGLKGTIFPDDQMDETQWEKVFLNMLIFFIDKERFSLFLEIDPHVTFLVLLDIFEPSPLVFIKKNS